MITPNSTSYSGDQSSFGDNSQNSQPREASQNTSKSALDPQNRPLSINSPQISRMRPTSSPSIQPTNIDKRMQNGNRSPAPRPAVMNRPPSTSVIPPTNRNGFTRPINIQNGQSNSSAFAGKRVAPQNVRPTIARPYRPMNPSASSRAPADI